MVSKKILLYSRFDIIAQQHNFQNKRIANHPKNSYRWDEKIAFLLLLLCKWNQIRRQTKSLGRKHITFRLRQHCLTNLLCLYVWAFVGFCVSFSFGLGVCSLFFSYFLVFLFSCFYIFSPFFTKFDGTLCLLSVVFMPKASFVHQTQQCVNVSVGTSHWIIAPEKKKKFKWANFSDKLKYFE